MNSISIKTGHELLRSQGTYDSKSKPQETLCSVDEQLGH